MNNIVKTTIAVSDLQQGMTVEVDGHLKTVDVRKVKPNYIYDGQRYRDGITRVQFAVQTASGIQLR